MSRQELRMQSDIEGAHRHHLQILQSCDISSAWTESIMESSDNGNACRTTYKYANRLPKCLDPSVESMP